MHAGPPCSSFTWLNRGTSKRSKESPNGDLSQRSVRQANLFLESIRGLLRSPMHIEDFHFCFETVCAKIQNASRIVAVYPTSPGLIHRAYPVAQDPKQVHIGDADWTGTMRPCCY